jgi:hypothetical protein
LGGEVLKGGVVGVDYKMRAVQIEAPSLEGVYDSEKLLLVSWVIALCWVEFPGGEGNWA